MVAIIILTVYDIYVTAIDQIKNIIIDLLNY